MSRTVFFQVLRASAAFNDELISQHIPLGGVGEKVQVVFRAGAGELLLRDASVGRASRSSRPTNWERLTFGGQASARLSAGALRRSDWARLGGEGDEVWIRFRASGAVASSTYARFAGEGSLQRAWGVAQIDVEGPSSRSFLVFGDSITEGFIAGSTDARTAWPTLAQRTLGFPVLASAWSGQTLQDASRNLAETAGLKGVTDCVVLLGTNSLGRSSVETIETELGAFASALSSRCRVWVGTLVGKNATPWGELSSVRADLLAVNRWVRAQPHPTIDFAAAMAGDVEGTLREALSHDGVHPNALGQEVLAQTFVAAIRARLGP